MKMFRTRLNLPIAFAVLILAFSAFALGADTTEDPELKDPELKQCKHQCRAQQGFGEEEIEKCSQRCDWYHEEKIRREREKGGGGQKQQGGESSPRYPWGEGEQQEEGRSEGQQDESPYVFQDHHFMAKVHTRGRYRFLPKFTHRSSKLFRGIENFRFAIVEAEPRTFIVPSHWDADGVSLVLQGEATMSLVREDKRESFNIRRGDVVMIPSGITRYIINRHKNQKLIIAELLRPVSNPGEFVAFFPAGSQEPESYLRAFTPEILAAALNRRTDELQKTIFGSGQQRREAFIEASEEQIQAFSQHGEGGIWPFRGETKGTINILDKSPTHSNEFGRLHEVAVRDFRELQDVNVAVSYTNITQGGMLGPLYNSRTTLLSFVVRGYGNWEMSCPHLSSEQQGREGSEEKQGTLHYQKVSSRLSPGVAFIVPPAHPYLTLASKDQNLEIVSFKINAIGNERFPLTGKSNVIIKLERPAKELAFGRTAKAVDKAYGNQKEQYFFMGPELIRQQGGGGGRAEA